MDITCVPKFLISIVLSIISTVIYAAGPLWTLTPISGSYPVQTVPMDGIAVIQYQVQNQAHKSKRLVIQPMVGITQIGNCTLAPKGQSGDNCVLTLSIRGSDIPETGIKGGPSLCLANLDNSPNQSQCYEPSDANRLNITRGAISGATISATPTDGLIINNLNPVATLTITNLSSSSAYNIKAQLTVPLANLLSVDNSQCVYLTQGNSCDIILSLTNGSTTTQISPGQRVSIFGDNTNTVSVLSVVYGNQWTGCTADFGRGCYMGGTSSTYKGNFSLYSNPVHLNFSSCASAVGAQAIADCHCQIEGVQAVGSGTWVGILGTSTGDFSQRFPANITNFPIWSYGSGGVQPLIFLSSAPWVVNGPLQNRIYQLNRGFNGFKYWRGSDGGSVNCLNWTDGGSIFVYGTTGSTAVSVPPGSGWASPQGGNYACLFDASLFCAQKPS